MKYILTGFLNSFKFKLSKYDTYFNLNLRRTFDTFFLK